MALVEDEVRELVRRHDVDPLAAPDAVRRLVDDVLADVDRRAVAGILPTLSPTAAEQARRTVVDAVTGLGPLQRYLDDPSVEEVWVNEPARVFVARRGRSELTDTVLRD